MKQIEFYFDLGSPYSYLGFYQIQKIAKLHQAQIVWKPILLGGVFKATGNSSPMTVPAKARYSMVDMQRWSNLWDISIHMNPYFPINTLNLMRIITAVQLYRPECFLTVLNALFDAMFGHPQNLNDIDVLMNLIESLGFSAEQVQIWLSDDQVKMQLKQITEEAIERGVFGAPTWFVGKEMFWGVDHLHFVEMELNQQ
ncbi:MULTISPECIES: 2-hydroxychromene-2-carboxylate isomerase [Acinetobacter]|uniref:2-hydroxychromene-2-carboxylate isomerase n=1 Tax=Acinetobacter TaxID=469 RepID=UPI0002AED053|nr:MULTISPECIES: 2-hydroxychromene-2-carboxylate isomerase [Acinetobacter]ELW89919.1 DSBA-like thioredoxin domain protein [Acinetobacter sp. WC-743]MBJ8427617.1 2-hydroxychromene-2-carboxylate isomerase [Acinetobacter bereziniae]MBJ8477612.1 2-hydroxychromene-2-carboxylate isomerase [Acinetobacter bereziniae]